MIILGFFVILSIIGLGLYFIYRNNCSSMLDVAGKIITTISIMILVCLSIGIAATNISGQNNIIAYQNDKAQIEIAMNNSSITEAERQNAIQIAITDNNIILRTRYWRTNPFINIFIYGPIGNLQTFDISKIKVANPVITINKR